MYCSVCGRDSKFHSNTVWGLFEKIGRRYHRVGLGAARKCDAIRAFQTMLLTGQYTIRRIKGARTID